jgi:hypothetical protein
MIKSIVVSAALLGLSAGAIAEQCPTNTANIPANSGNAWTDSNGVSWTSRVSPKKQTASGYQNFCGTTASSGRPPIQVVCLYTYSNQACGSGVMPHFMLYSNKAAFTLPTYGSNWKGVYCNQTDASLCSFTYSLSSFLTRL